MNKLRHFVGGLVFFAVCISLILTTYNDLATTYSVTETGLVDGVNIMDSLNNLNIISGLNKTVTAYGDLTEPKTGGSSFDITGALLTGGIGFLQIVVSLITTPFEIINIVSQYYELPPVIPLGINILIISYVIFIVASAYLRGDL